MNNKERREAIENSLGFLKAVLSWNAKTAIEILQKELDSLPVEPKLLGEILSHQYVDVPGKCLVDANYTTLLKPSNVSPEQVDAIAFRYNLHPKLEADNKKLIEFVENIALKKRQSLGNVHILENQVADLKAENERLVKKTKHHSEVIDYLFTCMDCRCMEGLSCAANQYPNTLTKKVSTCSFFRPNDKATKAIRKGGE